VNVIEYRCLRDLKILNDGAFGIVYRAEHVDWGTVAYKELKAIHINQETKSVSLDVYLCSPTIPKYYDSADYGLYLSGAVIFDRCVLLSFMSEQLVFGPGKGPKSLPRLLVLLLPLFEKCLQFS